MATSQIGIWKHPKTTIPNRPLNSRLWQLIRRYTCSSVMGISVSIGCATAADTGYDPITCGSLGNNYLGKPVDFRTAPVEQRNLVERAHFNTEHSQIMRGATTFRHGENSGSLMGGFDYTLRVFPNHPFALQDIDRLGLILKTEKPQNASYPLECYYMRAVQFVPDDGIVRLLYGLYLSRRGKAKEALSHLLIAQDLLPDDANVQYNLGLAFFYSKDFDSAKKYAKQAYANGFPLPGLRQMLIKAGKWD